MRLFAGWIVLSLCLGAGPARAELALVHVVRPGETLASIADRYYGDPRRESVLVTDNGLTSQGGSAIVVGLRLHIPSVSFHTVAEGETWSELAKRYYGDAKRAFILIQANDGRAGMQPDTGAELLIPYPLRHVAGPNDSVQRLAKLYYPGSEGTRIISRFNSLRRTRLQRGEIILIPLSNLVLTDEGKRIMAEQRAQKAGGEIRAKQERIDEQLPLLREHLRRGRFADALAMGNRLLGGGDLTGNQMVTIHRVLATAYVAFDRHDLAQRAFMQALRQQPDLELDSVSTSPAVLRAFKAAREEHKRREED